MCVCVLQMIGCTVIPGYVRTVGRYLIRDCTNTSLSYNPEFIAQGDIVKGLEYPDMVRSLAPAPHR